MTDQTNASRNVASLAIVFEGGLIVLALAIAWWSGRPPLPGVEWTWRAWPAGVAALSWGLVATVPMLLGLVVLDRHPVGPFAQLQRLVEYRLAPLFAGMTVLEMAAISLAAGFGEEMLFRGLLQVAVRDWVGAPHGVWSGLVIAALAFGACHWVTRTYAVLAALMGLYFGILLIATDNLLTPIVAHALYDFFALLYLVRWKHREPEPKACEDTQPEDDVPDD
ncbi:MAG: CPBP family intramembrane metalloprotease [Planctomycetes bacterium]|nr:CPBP family intramembrane metalloprotease [Planctomycetota bacterium]MBL7041554.1 CPBP family intramembrane metalloprotease [Pirellulaceae bacterium]